MANTLTISWTAPSIGSTPVSYEYAYCLSTDNIESATVNSTNSTSATLYPVGNGITYKYRVRSVGVSGLRSRWSQVYTIFCAPPPNRPTTTPIPTTSGPTNTPIPNTNTPLPPTSTPVPGTFGLTVVFGIYPRTSPGNVTVLVRNTTSVDKYLWLYGNSTYSNSGTISGTMSDGTTNISINETITGQNQDYYGIAVNNTSYIYLPANTSKSITVVNQTPSGSNASFLIRYTDTNQPTKINVPVTY